MKKAYLIQAFNQPLMLRKLVTALSSEQAYFFIHIDAKFDISPFSEALKDVKNVQFSERTKINWMGYSQVKAWLDLMRQAQRFQNFDYYSILSGSDYPIKSNQYINDFFNENKTEYISFWKLEDRPGWLHKIEYYYLTDRFAIRDYYPKITLRGIYWRLFFRLRNSFPKRSFLKGITPYGGSGWWSLTHHCVKFILDYVDNHPEFVNYFRYVHAPDEMFFQTIVMNSKFAESVQNYEVYNNWSRAISQADKLSEKKMLAEDSFNLRYIDWSGEITHERERPAILDERDFEAIKNSRDLFARKFDLVRSSKLLEMIDKELLR